jgi:hypothetical protein
VGEEEGTDGWMYMVVAGFGGGKTGREWGREGNWKRREVSRGQGNLTKGQGFHHGNPLKIFFAVRKDFILQKIKFLFLR